MNLKPVVFCIGFIFVSLFCFARNYSVVNIGTKGELTDNYIHAIYKDYTGFIWLGTGTTVERWDGIESVAYSFPEYNIEYVPYLVHAIQERDSNEYWVGCKKGLGRLNHVDHTVELMFTGQINFPVYGLEKDDKNRLYAGTTNGLYVIDGKDIRHIPIKPVNTLSDTNIVLDIQIVEDNVWLLTPDGVALCDPQSGSVRVYPNTIADCERLLSFVKVGDSFYIGTEKRGIIHYDLSGSGYSLFYEKVQAPVSALSHENGYLAVATSGEGILLLSLTEERLVYSNTYSSGTSTHTGLLSNRVSCLLLSEGNIWCGMDYHVGMNYLRNESTLFNLYSCGVFNSEGMAVRSVFICGDQTFVSSRDGFYCIKGEKQLHHFNSKNTGEDKLRSDLIFSFYEYDGKILIGTYQGGVSVMVPETYTFLVTPLTKTLTKNDIFMFLEDEEGYLWIASSDGLYRYDKKNETIKEYNSFNSGIPGNMVYSIHIDTSGRFWLGTDWGVTLFDRRTEKCTRDVFPESFVVDDPVRMIYEGRDGTLFFCLLGKEKYLLVLDKELKNIRYPFPAGCHNVMQDDRGHYWLGCEFGVIKMTEELHHYTLYTSADGLPDAIMTSGAPIIKDNDNRLWIANNKGLIIVDPEMIVPVSPMVITDISVNGKQIIDGVFTSNPGFQFASLGYEDPDKLKYEFMLEGYDTDWIRQDYKNRVSYYNLSPGEYVFRVRRLMNNDSMTEVAFKIGRVIPVLPVVLGSFLVILVLLLIFRHKKYPVEVVKESNISEPELTESYARLTEEEAVKIMNALKCYMENEKPFLNIDLRQSDVATSLGFSTFQLSAIFTYYLKTGYYDYVNTYRIKEFKCKVEAGEYEKYTLFTLAEKCGFKSKASFFRVFKKMTGLTPNEYIKQQKKTDQ